MATNKSIPTTALATIQEKPKGPKPKVNQIEIANRNNKLAITSRLDRAQALKGARALLKHLESKRKEKKEKALASGQPRDLFAEDGEDGDGVQGSGARLDYIWLVLTTKKFITDKKKIKPARIQLPHPLHDPVNTSACLIVKPPQRHYKDLVKPSTDSTVQKVIDITHLRKKFKTFESRRQLRDSYDLFLADDRIVLSLKRALGTTFLRSTKKVPIPLSISDRKTTSAINGEIEKAVKATYLHLSPNTGTDVRIGRADMSAEQLIENIEKAMEYITRKIISGGWKGVRSLYIKAIDSVALPIYLAERIFEEKDIKTQEDIEQERLKVEERKKKREERRDAKVKKMELIEEIGGKRGRKRKVDDDAKEEVNLGAISGSPMKKTKVERTDEKKKERERTKHKQEKSHS